LEPVLTPRRRSGRERRESHHHGTKDLLHVGQSLFDHLASFYKAVAMMIQAYSSGFVRSTTVRISYDHIARADLLPGEGVGNRP
jgi:hypothetical protein